MRLPHQARHNAACMLRIPMRGYETDGFVDLAVAAGVTNPHEGL